MQSMCNYVIIFIEGMDGAFRELHCVLYIVPGAMLKLKYCQFIAVMVYFRVIKGVPASCGGGERQWYANYKPNMTI